MNPTEKRQIMTENPPKAKIPADRTGEMSFLEHLEELRWRIIKGAAGIGLGVIVAFFFSDFLVNEVLLGPAKSDFIVYNFFERYFGMEAVDLTLQSRRLPGQFFTYWGMLILVGGIIGSPIFFYQLWAFIEPALESHEKWRSRLNTVFITGFFLMGVCFGYFILVPFALQFFTQFQIAEVVRNDFDINQYFSSLATWVISCGIIFQLPVISYFFAKFGFLTPEFLRKYRRHAIVACFVVAAALTPPDPVSQTLVAVPLILLFQLSIYIAKVGVRQREKELKRAFGDNNSTY
jgi:sec-independent protein translocase protein TatC